MANELTKVDMDEGVRRRELEAFLQKHQQDPNMNVKIYVVQILV